MEKRFLMPRDVGCPADAEMTDKRSSKMELKRDPSGLIRQECNKKQAVEAFSGRPVSSFHHVSSFSLVNASYIQSGPAYLGNGLYGLQPAQSVNFFGKDASSVNQVVDINNGVFTLAGHSHCPKKDKKVGKLYGNCSNTISPKAAPIHTIGGSSSSLGYGFCNANYNFMFTGQGSSNTMSIGPNSSKVAGGVFSSGIPSGKDDCSLTLGQLYEKSDSNVIPIGAGRMRNGESIVTLLPYGKANEKANSSFPLLGHASDCQSSGFTNSSDFVLSNQTSSQAPAVAAVPEERRLVESDVNAAPENPKLDSESGSFPKTKKQTYKESPQGFPTNVKCLLLTGIFEGADVKYVSWSREKSVRAVINRTGYLCGCEKCKLCKTVNAQELELHAGCKTKHPNSNIYFENGMTIYQVVQELRNTPQDKLFAAIRNMMGPAINEKNFGIWKGAKNIVQSDSQ